MPAPALLRVSEVADRLDCSRQHVYDLIAAGHLAAVNIGINRSQVRIYEDELAAYIKSRSRRAS